MATATMPTDITLTNYSDMKILKYTAILAAAVSAAACSSLRKPSFAEVKSQADALFEAGDYTLALEKYKQLMANAASPDSAVARNASIAANKLGMHTDAAQWGMIYPLGNDTARVSAAFGSLKALNRTAEAVAIAENHTGVLASVSNADSITAYMASYYNNAKSDKLVPLYNQINGAQLRARCFDTYFGMVKDSLPADKLTQICKSALADNPKSVPALEYMATSLYEKAEAQYTKVMNDYNKNKNATTYAYLRRDLKRISAVYRDSRSYFDRLREIDESNKNYVRYLVNIYIRLDNHDKAKKLKNLLD